MRGGNICHNGNRLQGKVAIVRLQYLAHGAQQGILLLNIQVLVDDVIGSVLQEAEVQPQGSPIRDDTGEDFLAIWVAEGEHLAGAF